MQMARILDAILKTVGLRQTAAASVKAGAATPAATTTAMTAATTAARTLSAAPMNEFAAHVYAKLAEDSAGNIFFSPYSIHVAMTMMTAGAKGETAQQLAALLGDGATADERNAHAKQIAASLRDAQSDGAITLKVANRVWMLNKLAVLDSYQRTLRDYFSSAMVPADFIGNVAGVRSEINGWVGRETGNKICDLIADGMITLETRMLLVNAIYFYGEWLDAFKTKSTTDEPFKLDDASTVNVPLMYGHFDHLPYAESDAAQIVQLPYKNGRMAMLVVLPKPGANHILKEGNVAANTGNLPSREVKLWLPRFKSSGEFEVSRVLMALGAKNAFGGEADFSGMTGHRDLYLSAMIHKAVIEVNEKGTEAAAATAGYLELGAEPPPEPPVEFRADHPFIYAIIDRWTRAILFLGRMVNPAAN